MFRYPPAAIALAVLAAFAAPARAGDLPAADNTLQPAQTYFPVAGGIDTERNNATSILTRVEVAEQKLDGGMNISTAYERTPSVGAQHRRSSFSLLAEDADGSEITVGVGGLAPQYFGAAALQLRQGVSLAQETALANPYLSLVPDATHAAFARQVGRVKIRVGVLTSGFNSTLASQETVLSSSAMLPQATSGLVEVSKSFGAAALSLSLSQTRESNAYLGSYANGPLSLGTRSSTSALQLAGAVMLGPKLALAGQAAYGVTPGAGGIDGLVTEVSTARTNAFSLALVAADRIKRGDRLSVSLSQPMRTYSGRLSIDMLSRSSGSGQSREHLVLSMVPVGREMRVQLSYQMPAGQGARFGAALIVRRNPNNLDNASVEKLFVLRYVKQF